MLQTIFGVLCMCVHVLCCPILVDKSQVLLLLVQTSVSLHKTTLAFLGTAYVLAAVVRGVLSTLNVVTFSSDHSHRCFLLAITIHNCKER
jgi:hypothetical protein